MIRPTFITPARALTTLCLCMTSLCLSSARAVECRSVRGSLAETAVIAGCPSPVGLCTVAQMTGQLTGQAHFIASAIIPSADTPLTSVVFVTGDTTILDARLGNRQGTLVVKNAAAYRTTGNGDLSDTQVIVGGSGDFAPASGALRISGTFVDGNGTASFEGEVCFQ
jgi:hypothetical protein